MDSYLLFLILLFVVAIFLQDRFVIGLFYFFVGIYLAARWWSNIATRQLVFLRNQADHAFIGDDVHVRLVLANQGWLPVVWLRVQDTLPSELASSEAFKRVISLAPRSRIVFDYDLYARKRGRYPVGPVKATSGDLFGFGIEKQAAGSVTSLVVFPAIYTMAHFSLPTVSPLGTLRKLQPLLEDPNWPAGKREYQVGDSIRRIDWKATAKTGQLLVKQFDSTSNLEAVIFLNMNLKEYDFRDRLGAAELAVTVAASIANWAFQHKQACGLATTGVDVNSSQAMIPLLTPGKGEDHLMLILETLACIQPLETDPFHSYISRQRAGLTWGSTVIIITGSAPDELLDEIFQSRRAGLNLVLILVGNVAELALIRQKALIFNIPIHHIRNTMDLEALRG